MIASLMQRLAHRNVSRNLPWYANGTLSAREQHRVEAHLKVCAECRDALAADRALMAVLSAEDEAELKVPWMPPRTAGVGQLRRVAVRRGVIAIPLGAAAVLLAVIVAVPLVPTSDAPYQTLTAPAEHTSATLKVLLAPSSRAGGIEAVAQTYGLAVDGPVSETGVWTLLPPQEADISALVERLSADPRVAFVSQER